MNTPAIRAELPSAQIIENALAHGDLKDLTPEQRNSHLLDVCNSLGLNWRTQPFEYLMLNGRLVLYAKRAATDQLRKINEISVEIVGREMLDGLMIVTARATTKDGRSDEDYGVVAFKGGANEAAANTMMKCATKAKRRVTLSICGLGFLDESEIPGQRERPATISKDQIKALKTYATEINADIPAFLDHLSDRWELDIGKLADIPVSHYEDAMGRLKFKADHEAAQKHKAAIAEAEHLAAVDPVTGEVADAG
jgi:hypothetical protein